MILSQRLTRNLKQTNINPIIVLEIEDAPYLYGSDTIKRYPRYGDEGLEYGDEGLFYGGLVPYPNQKRLVSIAGGTTTSIKQSLNPDKARGSGISQFTVALLDKNNEATKLASGVYGEVLFKKVKVWVGFGEDSAWNEDFILVFRGRVESISSEQGIVKLFLNSPDQKKRASLLYTLEADADGPIDISQTTIDVTSVENLFIVPDHPGYSTKDPALATFVRIDDEVIEVGSIVGTQLQGCTRGALGTVAATHGDQTQVESVYRLQGTAMDLALKVMLSDADQTSYLDDFAISVMNWNGVEASPGSIFFADKNLQRDYNVNIGDWIKTSGFIEGANNLSSWTLIQDVIISDLGTTIVVDAALAYEISDGGVCEMLSQYNTLGSFGLGLDVDEVDINEHQALGRSFLSDFELRFFLVDEISDGKEWLEKEIYLPASCYSLPTDREGLARVSVGIHKAPLPNRGIVTLSQDNIADPKSLSIKRSVNKYYYNAVVFLYEDTPIDPELRRRKITSAGTVAVATGNRPLVIESRGLKKFYNADSLAADSASRLLERYKSAAEYIEKMEVLFRVGVQISIGDIVVLDPEGLNMLNSTDSNRSKEPLLMEVLNKDFDFKGTIKLDLIDTSFEIDARYGLVSPSSQLKQIISQTKFVISPLFATSVYGTAEYRKWIDLLRPAVKIRRRDFSEVFETVLTSVNLNTLEIQDVPDFTIAEGDVIEFANYDNVNTTDQQKLIYAYISDGTNNFADGKAPYLII